MKKIRLLLDNLESSSNKIFIIKIVFIALLPKTIVIFLLFIAYFLGVDIKKILQLQDLSSYSYSLDNLLNLKQGFFSISWLFIIAPLSETLVNQALVIKLTSFITKKTWILILISTITFILIHEENNKVIPTYVGTILAWSYIIKSKSSFWNGLWTTTAIHSLINILSVLPLFIFKFIVK
ncbi:hypothetical protein C4577_03180 [Candidatus Parcubacteria bacterium]|nr:MAG: hypothetical protein C4577_03180 [Candidatus Parcubacteria bacterium]